MRPISKQLRASILVLLDQKLSTRKIAAKLAVSNCTVHCVAKEAKKDISGNKGGRPGKLTSHDKDFCVRQVTRKGLETAV